MALHQPVNARADASRTSALALTDSVAIGSIGQPSRRSAVSPATSSVNPPIDDVGHRLSAGQKPAQQLLDGSSGAVDDRGGQLLLSPREVVIQRTRLYRRLVQDLVEPGRRVPLAAEQGGRGIDQRGPAAVWSRHAVDNT